MSRVLGVGTNDLFRKKFKNQKMRQKAYHVWYDMIKRCYDEKSRRYKDWGGKGVRVCDEWLHFSNFKRWFDENYIEGYCLDKDVIGNGKIYSPKHCCFITKSENTIECNKRKDYSYMKGENSFFYGKKGPEHPAYGRQCFFRGKKGEQHPSFKHPIYFEKTPSRIDQFKDYCKRHNLVFDDFRMEFHSNYTRKNGRVVKMYLFFKVEM